MADEKEKVTSEEAVENTSETKENVQTEETETLSKEDVRKKEEVEKKIKSQIEKKQEKEMKLGIFRIGDYLKEEHKWETWLFIAVSLITLMLGCLILNHSLLVKDDFPIVGTHTKVFAWILVVAASLGLVYAIWPFFKPALPEFKKVTWLTFPKFVANCVRVFVFLIIFISLFLLYDYLMVELFGLIF